MYTHLRKPTLKAEDVADKPIILFLVRNSWGEIDANLPILAGLRQHYPNHRFITLFAAWDLMQKKQWFAQLHHLLSQISDDILYPELDLFTGLYDTQESFRWANMSLLTEEDALRLTEAMTGDGVIDPSKIELILHENSLPNALLLQISARAPEARQLMLPHSVMPLYGEPPSPPHTVPDPCHLFLAGFEDYRRWYGLDPRVQIVGNPRFDRWWWQRLSTHDRLRSCEEARFCKPFKRTYLFVTRRPTVEHFDREDAEMLIRAFASVVFEDPEACVLLRLHPRDTEDNIRIVERLMNEYGEGRWMFTSLQATQAVSIADLVVSMWSSVVSDALVQGKPVIELFTYRAVKDPNYHGVHRLKNGELGSTYRYREVVLPADDRPSFEAALKGWLEAPEGPQWDAINERARDFFSQDQGSTVRSVLAIDKLLNPASTLDEATLSSELESYQLNPVPCMERPAGFHALLHKSRLLFAHQRMDIALVIAREALAQQPTDLDARQNVILGEVLMAIEHLNLAIAHLEHLPPSQGRNDLCQQLVLGLEKISVCVQKSG